MTPAFLGRNVNIDAALAERVLNAIDPEETIAFLQSLVRIPSINPPGDVRQAIQLCEEKLAGAGFATKTVGATPEKMNVIGTLRGREGARRLAFNAHLDVVPIGEEAVWTHPPFGGEIADGRGSDAGWAVPAP